MGNRALVFITDMASGGRQTFCLTLLNEWTRMGIDCSLYVSYGGGANLARLERRTEVFVADKAVSRSLHKMKRFADCFPDAPCLSLSTEMTIVLCFLKKLGLIRNPIYHRESMDPASMSLKWRLLIRLFFTSLSGMVVSSRFAGNVYANYYKVRHPVAVIRNPCRFAEHSHGTKLVPDLLLSVGRLDPVKGHDRLLRALAEFGDGYKLQVWGEGDARSLVQECIDGLNLGDKVTLCGHTDNVEGVYQTGGIVVFSSYHEGLPNAAIEALLCGCRVVVPECLYGAAELFEEIGLADCIVKGHYEDTLFPTISIVAGLAESVFANARARLVELTHSGTVATAMYSFISNVKE